MRFRAPRLSLPLGLGCLLLACSGKVSSDRTFASGGGTSSGAAMAPESSAAGASGASAAGIGGAGGGGIPVCELPKLDPSDGLIACANGFKHRAQAPTCSIGSASLGSGGAGAAGATGDTGLERVCTTDGDCNADQACLCNPAAYPDYGDLEATGICLPATCRTDADCGAESWCAVGRLIDYGDAIPGFGCLHATDQCTTDADCHSADKPLCFDEQGRRVCGLPI